MLRITENFENGKAVRLRLDGTLSDEAHEEFTRILAPHERVGGRTIIVDLAGVDFMSDESARQIAALQSKHVRIINCSPFIETLLLTLANQDSR
jgi:anti-anti-sigma regulatory factor